MGNIHELEDLYRSPSQFSDEVLEVARQWGDEIRPGLKDINGDIADPILRDDKVSPLTKLESRIQQFGISSPQSLAELALVGMRLSREKEQQEGVE
jgi:hypothetical protein